jgi:hypothetical protein
MKVAPPAGSEKWGTSRLSPRLYPDFSADLEFYTHTFPDRKLPPSLVDALKKPTFATRLGGGTTVLAGR